VSSINLLSQLSFPTITGQAARM